MSSTSSFANELIQQHLTFSAITPPSGRLQDPARSRIFFTNPIADYPFNTTRLFPVERVDGNGNQVSEIALDFEHAAALSFYVRSIFTGIYRAAGVATPDRVIEQRMFDQLGMRAPALIAYVLGWENGVFPLYKPTSYLTLKREYETVCAHIKHTMAWLGEALYQHNLISPASEWRFQNDPRSLSAPQAAPVTAQSYGIRRTRAPSPESPAEPPASRLRMSESDSRALVLHPTESSYARRYTNFDPWLHTDVGTPGSVYCLASPNGTTIRTLADTADGLPIDSSEEGEYELDYCDSDCDHWSPSDYEDPEYDSEDVSF